MMLPELQFHSSPRNTATSGRIDGFTLTELLAVLGIVAVLAAFLIPSVNRTLSAGQRAKCAGNLRQIGTALQAYLGENQMKLPYCWASLPCNPPGNAVPRQPLSQHLAPYLDEVVVEGERLFVPVFQCPAWPRQYTAAEALATETALDSYRIALATAGGPSPFGTANNSRTSSPMTIERDTGLSSSKFPVVFNMDQQLPFFPQPADDIPVEPLFGSGRNVLFLDGHVSFEEGLDFLGDRLR